MSVSPRRPLRVVHIARRFAPMVGGIERYVLDLARVQVRHGAEASVVTLRRDVIGALDGRMPARDRIDGIRVTRLPGIGGQRFAVCLRPDRLAREVRRADVVHLHDLRFMAGLVCVAARLTGRPLVFHTHGLLFHTPWAVRLKRIALRWYYGPLLRLCRAEIVASSEHDRELLMRDLPDLADRTKTLQNAIDLRPYVGLRREPIDGRLLVVGRVAERKGIDRLVTSLAALERNGHPAAWDLEIAGTEEAAERARLEGMIERAGLRTRVRFLGGFSGERHRELLSQAAVAIFPSRAEGFGLALLEAMASALPLVASDIPAHRSLLGADLTELLVDFDDPGTSAQAVDRLLRLSPQDREDLGGRLRARARAFDVERLWSEVDSLYRELGVDAESAARAY